MDLCLQVKADLLRVAHLVDEPTGSIVLEDLEELLTILEGESQDFVGPEIVKMTETVCCDKSLWPMLVTQSRRQQIINTATRAAKLGLSNSDNKRYLESWLKMRKFLDSLGRAHIVPKSWSLVRQKFPAISGSSFNASIRSGKLLRPVYSTAGSTTGRLTITHGPNFLIAPAEARHSLRASQAGSSVVIIDFSSMEPRAILAHSEVETGADDIYVKLMELCNIDNRPVAKLATISALYGASEMSLAAAAGSRANAKRFVEKVRDFFNVAELENELQCQADIGIVRNLFGRPLRDATRTPHLRVNHFAQSSGAELAVLLFAELCEAVPDVIPLFVIHDALVAEVPDSSLSALQTASQLLSFRNVKFPTTVKIL